MYCAVPFPFFVLRGCSYTGYLRTSLGSLGTYWESQTLAETQPCSSPCPMLLLFSSRLCSVLRVRISTEAVGTLYIYSAFARASFRIKTLCGLCFLVFSVAASLSEVCVDLGLFDLQVASAFKALLYHIGTICMNACIFLHI